MAGLATLAASVGLVLLPATTTPASAAPSTSGVSCSGGVCTQTFYSDGSWSQPTASGDVTVVAAGGAGGQSGDGTDGGKGRKLTLTTSEHALDISVGGRGADGDGTHGSAGGAHGGGNGGDASDGADGGGGGGGTYVLKGGTLTKLLVAGGGGGAGGGFDNGDKNNGYEPRNFGDGGDAGLNGVGTRGGLGSFQANAQCPDTSSSGGYGVTSNAPGGQGGKGGVRTGAPEGIPVPGYGGGDGGGGGGGVSGGTGGCSNQSAAGNGTDGSGGQGGNGGGNGNVGNCIQIGCTSSQSKNGGGGGGGGLFGGGGGGTGKGLAAGGGGGGASFLSTGATDAGLNDGAGFVTISWRYATPQLSVAGSSSLTSDGPGTNVPITLNVTGRQSGSGSAGKIFIADQYGDASTVVTCNPASAGGGRNVPNGTDPVLCAVRPTVDTTYAVTYEPSAQYVADGGGRNRQLARVTVTVGKEATVTTVASPGTVEAGASTTLRATVTSRTQRPTGVMSFDYQADGSTTWTPLGTVDTVVRADGRSADATLQTSSLPSSARQVRATYAGSATTGSSTGTASVNVISSVLSLELSSTQLDYGDRLTLTAVAPACTTQDAARVRFRAVDSLGRTEADYGSYAIGSDHRAQVTLTPSAGSLVLTAVGESPCDQSTQASSTPWQLVQINAAPTTVALDAPDSVLRGDSPSVTLRVATVNRASIPSGEVGFTYPTSRGGTGRITGTLSGGSFTANLRDIAAGESSVTAYFAGSDSYGRSFTTKTVQVTLPATTVTLSGAPQTAPYGGVVPLTATVTQQGDPVTEGSVQVATANGVVSGYLDATGHATLDVPVVGEPGAAQQGSVSYLGTENYAASDTAYSWTVGAAATTLTATQVGPAYTDGSVTLDISVSTEPATGQPVVTPAGGVSYQQVTPGISLPRRVDLSACSSCSVRRGTITLPAGSTAGARSYVVSYFDSTHRTAAAPVTVPVTVLGKRAVTIRGGGSVGGTVGDPVTVAFTVGDSAGPVSGGTVTLYDGTDAVASGPATSVLSFTPTWLGARTLDLTYSGDSSHQAASRSGFVTVAVVKASTTLQLTASRGSGEAIPRRGGTVAAGEPVTFTVSLQGDAPNRPLSGTVQMNRSDRDTPVDVDVKDGSGAVTFDDLTPGSAVTVYAFYGGSAQQEAISSLDTVVTVAPAPTPVTVTKVTPHRLARGTTTTVTISGAGFTDTTVPRLDDATGVTLGTVTHVSSTQLTVPVTLTSAAAAGSRTWSVADTATSGRAASCRTTAACGLVVYLVPKLTGTTGGSVAAGGTTTLSLVGSDFEAGMKATVSGGGVTVGPVQRTDDGHATVTVTVAAGQKKGSRTLTLLNPSGGRLVVKKAVTVVR